MSAKMDQDSDKLYLDEVLKTEQSLLKIQKLGIDIQEFQEKMKIITKQVEEEISKLYKGNEFNFKRTFKKESLNQIYNKGIDELIEIQNDILIAYNTASKIKTEILEDMDSLDKPAIQTSKSFNKMYEINQKELEDGYSEEELLDLLFQNPQLFSKNQNTPKKSFEEERSKLKKELNQLNRHQTSLEAKVDYKYPYYKEILRRSAILVGYITMIGSIGATGILASKNVCTQKNYHTTIKIYDVKNSRMFPIQESYQPSTKESVSIMDCSNWYQVESLFSFLQNQKLEQEIITYNESDIEFDKLEYCTLLDLNKLEIHSNSTYAKETLYKQEEPLDILIKEVKVEVDNYQLQLNKKQYIAFITGMITILLATHISLSYLIAQHELLSSLIKETIEYIKCSITKRNDEKLLSIINKMVTEKLKNLEELEMQTMDVKPNEPRTYSQEAVKILEKNRIYNF